MRLYSIASGSSGNCIYIGDGDTHILIDAGVSCKKIEAALKENSLTAGEIQGVFVTHEHSDHICGLGVLARRYHIPIYATYETIERIKRCKTLGEMDDSLFNPIFANLNMQIGDLMIHPFSIPHDAVNPVAYRVTSRDNKSVAVATDIGYFNDYIVENLMGLDAILIEANHDVHMLQTGPYPYVLKQRILSNHGHLSNENSGKLLNRILNDKLKYILLGHLSKENNYEELAYETVRLEIAMGDNEYRTREIPIKVAKRDFPTEMITV